MKQIESDLIGAKCRRTTRDSGVTTVDYGFVRALWLDAGRPTAVVMMIRGHEFGEIVFVALEELEIELK